jgi:hypothetical protein
MMIPGKELDSSSEIPIISFNDIISQQNPVIWLAEKTLTIKYAAPADRSNFLIKEAQGNAESYNQLIRLFSYRVIDQREQTVEEAPTIRFYGMMIVSSMASNIVSLIFHALTCTGGIIAN